jgi:histidyl-tRNA synthetase
MSKIKIKPSNPKGVRDLLPNDCKKREYIIQVLKNAFELFSFEPIYTPSFERLETLMGKSGEESDTLLFKILNSGDFMSNEALDLTKQIPLPTPKLIKEISSKGLRYDLTVPLARFVAQHQNELTFPFRRYHIAPVWRADRPQKGRYQEFFQCDVDVIGTDSLYCEVEAAQLIQYVFEKLNLKVTIKVNNRSLFSGICHGLGIESMTGPIATLIDKWDKIGKENVIEQLLLMPNMTQEKVHSLINLFEISNYDEINLNNEMIEKGKKELAFLFSKVPAENLVFDGKLLRGLDYYTGCIFEVSCDEVQMGSIGGGGRYDNLTEIFGMNSSSGFGFSFGLDRIYDCLIELDRFGEYQNNTSYLILNLCDEAEDMLFEILASLRRKGISAELFPKKSKMDKQLVYADKKGIEYAIIIGEDEWHNNKMTIKSLKNRTQELVDLDFFKQDI